VIEVNIVCEGPTEEGFVWNVLAPTFWPRDLNVRPRLIPTSRYSRGGALSRDRILRYLRNTLRERADVYVTTFFDLYGLMQDFPGVTETASVRDPIARATTIEARFAEAVVREAECRADRFVPHIQPFEFEALLFSDVSRFPEIHQEWQAYQRNLESARRSAVSPEHINDGRDTHPSARLKTLLRPRYEKVLHGTAIAARIGLVRIRAECVHFATWLSRLENLTPLVNEA
jgi:Domain of unknown function (DUF4276)